jgi:hypothetical protein
MTSFDSISLSCGRALGGLLRLPRANRVDFLHARCSCKLFFNLLIRARVGAEIPLPNLASCDCVRTLRLLLAGEAPPFRLHDTRHYGYVFAGEQ